MSAWNPETYRISGVRQLTIHKVPGRSADLDGQYTDSRLFKPNQASHTPVFSYPCVFSALYASSSHISLSRPEHHHYS